VENVLPEQERAKAIEMLTRIFSEYSPQFRKQSDPGLWISTQVNPKMKQTMIAEGVRQLVQLELEGETGETGYLAYKDEAKYLDKSAFFKELQRMVEHGKFGRKIQEEVSRTAATVRWSNRKYIEPGQP
jgi:hypothetical protein